MPCYDVTHWHIIAAGSKSNIDQNIFCKSFLFAIDWLLKIKDVKSNNVDTEILAKINTILTYTLSATKFPDWRNKLTFKLVTEYINKFDIHVKKSAVNQTRQATYAST